ncbi:flavin reductase [Alkalihalophilus pseudofirmus]|nr:flavin reductase [Alkalihalophilus pseudofirmus]
MEFDFREFRNAMGGFATGVTVISVENEGEVHGMTANAFSSVSLDPPLVLVCIDNRANSLSYIKESGFFGVNFLDAEQEGISRLFAKQKVTKDPVFKFEKSNGGAPLLKDALVNLNCKVYQTIDAGDHTIFIGEVLDLKVKDGEPLCFYKGQYRKLG